jgi:hypothetical protein
LAFALKKRRAFARRFFSPAIRPAFLCASPIFCRNPDPGTKGKFTRHEFVAFAKNYLGGDVIFWSATSPWLREVAR